MLRKTRQTRCTRSTSSNSIGVINPRTCDNAARIWKGSTLYDAFRRPRPFGPGIASCGPAGLQHPHPCAGAGHPQGAQRPRPDRRREDRHGQDRRVQPAHHGQARACQGQQGTAHAGGNPHARACRADRRGVRHHRQEHAPSHPHRSRRRFLQPADPGAQPRRRRAHRHAGPSGRSHGPRRRASEQRGSARARRSRPHARHGLLAGHAQDHRPPRRKTVKPCCSAPPSTAPS